MATNANITVAIVNVLMTAVSLPHPTYLKQDHGNKGSASRYRTVGPAAALQDLLMAQGLANGRR